jgi:hypothetical protein
MTKATPAQLYGTRFLRLRQIANLWAPELRRPEALILDELRFAYLNLPRIRKGEGLLNSFPPDAELPDPDVHVDQNWIMEFAMKQGWSPPRFWMGNQEPFRSSGRPTERHRVLKIFHYRVNEKLTDKTISEEARTIHRLLQTELRGISVPSAKTIQGHIRKEWHERS